MKIELIHQTPIIRCSDCGSPDVVAYCHHCGKPMCAKHGPVKPGLYWFTENREFQGFSMAQWPLNGKQGAHCNRCAHSSLNYRRILIYPGILIAFIFLFIFITQVSGLVNCISNLPESFPRGQAIFSEAIRDPTIFQGVQPGRCYLPSLIGQILETITGLALLAIGLSMVIVGFLLIRRRKKVESVGEFGVPVHLGPVTDQIKAIEALRAVCRIDEDMGVNVMIKGAVSGTVYPFLHFTPQDIQLVNEYRKKYALPVGAEIQYSAGYMVPSFRNNQKIQFENGSSNFPNKFVPLQGPLSRQPYLNGNKGSAESWAIEPLSYSFCPPQEHLEDWDQVPVRIFPLLEEMGSSQEVMLQIQINTGFFPTIKNYKDTKPNEPPKVVLEDLILLQRAVIRGDMEHLGKPKTNGIVKELEDKKFFSVEWQNLWMLPQKGIVRINLPSMIFKNKFQQDTRLTGNLQVRVPALISGMEAVQYVSSLGFPVKDKRSPSRDLPFTGSTVIELDFDIALNKLPISKSKVYPGPFVNGSKSREECGKFYYESSPTPEQVQKFLNAISRGPSTAGDSYMYLRSVVQDPKRVSEDPNAEHMWYWDVTGRHYYDVTPIDFHLVIYGVEGETDHCRTYVELSVKSFLCDSEKDGRDWTATQSDSRKGSNKDGGEEVKGILKITFDMIKAQADETLGKEG